MKKILLALVALFTISTSTFAIDDDIIYDVADERPVFPGGEQACMRFISQNLNYPPSCIDDKVQGRVVVTFVVNADGSISNATANANADRRLAAEAVRVVNIMPRWKPGKVRGNAVRTRYNLPVIFRLPEPSTRR